MSQREELGGYRLTSLKIVLWVCSSLFVQYKYSSIRAFTTDIPQPDLFDHLSAPASELRSNVGAYKADNDKTMVTKQHQVRGEKL